jgi:glycine C-acetyltransferase
MHCKSGLREKGFNIGDTNTCYVYLEGSIPEAMIMVNDLKNYNIYLLLFIQ